MSRHVAYLVNDKTRNRDSVLRQLWAFHRCMCPICDMGLDVYRCCACQSELVSFELMFDTEDAQGTGGICRACYDVLPQPLPKWLSIIPQSECLHRNRTAKGFCRDCRMPASVVKRDDEQRYGRPQLLEPIIAAECRPAAPAVELPKADFTPVLCEVCGANINDSGLLARYRVEKCNGRFGHQLSQIMETTPVLCEGETRGS